MKNIKSVIAAVLAMVMLCSVMLTGCGVPKIAFNKIPETAATYGDNQKLTSGEYLAYLYLEFENMYYNQGLYQYEAYGMDPWAQSFPYGEGDEKLALSDYIIRATQDNIKRQIVLAQVLKDNGLKWIAEDEKEINDTMLKGMVEDAFIDLGFNNDSYIYAMKNANLNERSAFYGLYGKNGPRAVKEEDIKKYFENNYVSYKMISIPLTDKNGKALDEKGEEYKKIIERMDKYEKLYKEKGFDAVKEQYDKDEEEAKKQQSTTTKPSATGTGTATGTTTAAPTTTTTTTAAPTTTTTAATTTGTHGEGDGHDHEEEEDKDPNRVDADSANMDEDLKKAIYSVDVGAGNGKKLTYKAGGSTPTVALIERLDIHTDRNGKKDGLYEDSVENIIYELEYEEFDKEVDAAVAKQSIVFNQKVIAKCKPEDFLTIINNL